MLAQSSQNDPKMGSQTAVKTRVFNYIAKLDFERPSHGFACFSRCKGSRNRGKNRVKNQFEKKTTKKLCKSGAPERLVAKSGPQRVPRGRPKIMKNEVLRRLASEGRFFFKKHVFYEGVFQKLAFRSRVRPNGTQKDSKWIRKACPKCYMSGSLWLHSRAKR